MAIMNANAEEKAILTVQVPVSLKEAYEKIAAREDRSLASMVRIVLENSLPEWENKTTIVV